MHILVSLLLVLTNLFPTHVRTTSLEADFGFSVGSNQPWNSHRRQDFAALQQAHASIIRVDIPWMYLQPDYRGQAFNWSLFDPVISDAKDYGLDTLAILHTVPHWANNSGGDYAPATDLSLQVNYCYKVAQRYLARGITKYEIGNEVNLNHPGWNPDGKFYTINLLNPCVKGLRKASIEAHKSITVLGASSAPTQPDNGIDPEVFLNQVKSASGLSQFDVVSWHPYTIYPLTDSAMSSTPDSLHSISNKPIWATEFGAPTSGEWSVSEQRQAELVSEAKSAWFSHSYAGPLFWYSSRDLGQYPSTEREDYFGVIRYDGSLKPAYYELQRSF